MKDDKMPNIRDYSVGHVAYKLNKSISYVYKLIEQGKIVSYNDGNGTQRKMHSITPENYLKYINSIRK